MTSQKMYNPEHNMFQLLRIHHNGIWKLSLGKNALDSMKCTLPRDLSEQTKSVSDVVYSPKKQCIYRRFPDCHAPLGTGGET